MPKSNGSKTMVVFRKEDGYYRAWEEDKEYKEKKLSYGLDVPMLLVAQFVQHMWPTHRVMVGKRVEDLRS